jgi:hypothetical protein
MFKIARKDQHLITGHFVNPGNCYPERHEDNSEYFPGLNRNDKVFTALKMTRKAIPERELYQ